MGNQAIDSNLSNEEQGLISFLGLFVMSWSLFEQTVDRAIMHQLDITAKQAAIVVCGIGFERKVSILRSLLRENEAAHKTVSEIIARIMNNASRNVLLHATISQNGLQNRPYLQMRKPYLAVVC